MDEAFSITLPSPDQQHTARLHLSGEVRFGPAYYTLTVDGYTFGDRIFGNATVWSTSSSFFAVQEWLTLDYSEGPITALLIVDLQLGRERAVGRAVKRFLVPETCEDTLLTYRSEHTGLGLVERQTIDITTLTEWSACA